MNWPFSIRNAIYPKEKYIWAQIRIIHETDKAIILPLVTNNGVLKLFQQLLRGINVIKRLRNKRLNAIKVVKRRL